MRAALSLLALCGAALVGLAQTADPVVQAVVARAIQAHGGAANLTKFRAVTWKGVGRFSWVGPGSEYTVTGARQLDEQAFLAVENEVNGQHGRLVRVVNGEHGWVLLNDRVQELDAAGLAEEKERMHANWLATLVPLLAGRLTCAAAGETDVAGRPATGVRLSSSGHRDVTLYFDRDTGLLRKKTTRVHDMTHGGQEVLQETLYDEYAVIDGARVAKKMQVRWDGKLYLELTLTEIKPQKNLPDVLFMRPQPQ